jgi:integrase
MDAPALEAAAIAAAQELNAKLDDTRVASAVTAARPVPVAANRTLGQLSKQFQDSDRWRALRPRTQVGYTQCLRLIEAWGGDVPVRAIDAARVQRLMKTMRRTPAYANAVVRVLRLLLEHGRREGWIAVNPAIRPALTATQPRGLIWPPAAIEAFVAKADELGWYSVGTAVALNAWLGQREGDILRLPWQAVRGDALVLRQSKRGAGVTLPIGTVPHLVARLEAERARQVARQGNGPVCMTVISHERTGLPWNGDTFRHVFAQIRAAAAETSPTFAVEYLLPGRDMTEPDAFLVRMAELTFQVLRHTAVTRLGEAGCELQQISSVTGHSIATVAHLMRVYMVHTAKMAQLAFAKRMAAEGIEATSGREKAG